MTTETEPGTGWAPAPSSEPWRRAEARARDRERGREHAARGEPRRHPAQLRGLLLHLTRSDEVVVPYGRALPELSPDPGAPERTCWQAIVISSPRARRGAVAVVAEEELVAAPELPVPLPGAEERRSGGRPRTHSPGPPPGPVPEEDHGDWVRAVLELVPPARRRSTAPILWTLAELANGAAELDPGRAVAEVADSAHWEDEEARRYLDGLSRSGYLGETGGRYRLRIPEGGPR